MDHSLYGGDACEGDGTCTTCGVLLDECPVCDGRGYHRAGCPDSEDTDTPTPPPRSGGVVTAEGLGLVFGFGPDSLLLSLSPDQCVNPKSRS